ncbi:VOC family protein [Cesiribacter sp. SM1]|uniref:VOC family protein n=1 Tax=Cesiribacter sp. SM1 TaxID=2861196 RepID=UPI001CD68319|nr:VOC family protein [Cesiribacter sp. SM1]
MTKELWINLPVKDINRSKAFFTSLGFSFNPQYCNGDDGACLNIGEKNVAVMLFKEELFKEFAGTHVAELKQGVEVLFSIDAESPQEVDALAEKVLSAGGTLYGEPGYKHGWMYGCGFIDPDGHRWSVLHMDMSKMPQRQVQQEQV